MSITILEYEVFSLDVPSFCHCLDPCRYVHDVYQFTASFKIFMKKCFMEIKRPERPRSEVYDRTHRYQESSIGTSDEGDRNAD